MLKEILSWDDDAVQFAAPVLRIVMPILLELDNTSLLLPERSSKN